MRMKSIRKSSLYFLQLFTAVFLSSCLSLTTLQSGKTLGKDNSEIAITGSSGRYSVISALDDEGDFDYLPLIAFRGQYGVSQKLDLGFRVDLNTFMGPSIKYQFIGNQNSLFSSSIGLETGLNFFAFAFGNFTYYASAPLYLSYHPKDFISINLTPRFINTSEYIFEEHSNTPGAGNRYSIIGSSYGLILGYRHKCAIEVSNFGLEYYKPTQFSIGYILTF